MSDQLQPSLFETRTGPDPKGESWSQVFARRMQSLLMGYPIHQMVARGESGHRPDWDKQNFTFLALQVFDSVFARMAPGVGSGATREELIHDLRPYILGLQGELNDETVAEIVDFLLDNLMNEGRGSFERQAVWLTENEEPKPYIFRFGLLKSYHDPDSDQFIIRATTEAIHLYLRMLDQPIEDEQISNLFILHEQVRRGRINRARREVERTMLLSLEYERYIESMLRAVRRDVRTVDWVREVTPKIEEAHRHVRRLIKDQGTVLSELKKELTRNSDRALQQVIRDLIEYLELCQRRHMELERRILAAGPAFLEEQAYQRFRSMARSPMPDLNEQVFLPSLELSDKVLRPHLGSISHTMLGPQIQKILDLNIFIDKLLREDGNNEVFLDEEEDEDRLPIMNMFNPLEDVFEEKLAQIVNRVDVAPIRLSELLQAGRDMNLELDQLSVLGVSFLQSYHARADLLGLRVYKDGKPLDDPDFMGDDLLIRRAYDPENRT